ncbi:MAG: patatin-like phospholipase family protein [Limisphaerales bacterium]
MKVIRRQDLPAVAVACALVLITGCASLRPRLPVPAALVEQAQIPGLPGVRMLLHPLHVDIAQIDHSLTNANPRAARGERPLTLLALSGGGGDGAFGAGVLCGWTAAGDRPEFDIVTGISTGALIGPYAFLGAACDAELKQNYTTISDKDICKKRGLFQILRARDAVMSTAPLAKLIAKQIDQARLEAIAAEHRKGRRFYVATSDLDAGRGVVWDMGAIAASGHPDALELFRKVLLASASIPVAFPPVYFDVEAGGKRFDEMHADGGVMSQVFGAMFLGRLKELTGAREGRLYLVRNAQLRPQWKAVQPKVVSIAGRTVSTLIITQGFGDLYRAYLAAQAGEVDFNLAAIPADFDVPREGEFDPVFMRALFDRGYEQARGGFPWAQVPPGFEAMKH